MEPSTVGGSILLGVVSGILTTMLLVLAGALARRVIAPWYQEFVYRGMRIEGDWIGTSDGISQESHWQLRQRAQEITGTCTFVEQGAAGSAHEAVRTFSLKGLIQDRFFEVSLRHVDQSRLGTSVFLLEVTGDGRIMKGYVSYYGVKNSLIVSDPIVLRRPSVPKPGQMLNQAKAHSQARKPGGPNE